MYNYRAFKRSTFRLNVIICIGIFLGFLGDLVHTLSVRILLEDIAGMNIVVNVSPVSSCIIVAYTVLLSVFIIFHLSCLIHPHR